MKTGNIVKEVDGLQESLFWISLYEEKYDRTTEMFLSGAIDGVSYEDKMAWNMYVKCKNAYLKSSKLETKKYTVIEDLVPDFIRSELIVENNKEEGSDFKKSLPSSFFIVR